MTPGAIVTDYAHKFANGQISEIENMLDEHIEYWLQGAGSFSKSEILDIMQGIVSKVESAHTEILDVIEMKNKAAVTMKTFFKLKSGEDVVDELCVVAEISDGRLVRIREYLDQRVMHHFMV